MYCGVNSHAFSDTQGVPAILSAAEMLQPRFPKIAGAFVRFASGIVQNFLAQSGSTPELDAAFVALAQAANQSPCATVKELERFADSLVASADGIYSADFYRIAYLAYTATSMQGPLSNRVITKMTRAEQFLELDENPPGAFGGGGGPGNLPNPIFTGGGGPPQFTPNPGAPPSSGGPPQFNPYSQGPPQFGQGPPQYPTFDPRASQQVGANQGSDLRQSIPGIPQYPTFQQGGPTPNYQSAPPPAGDPQATGNALRLAEMARDALDKGSPDMALSLILAATKELEK
ncbi:hypothetical protein TRFO_28160 [Tritrichomonas foetus]|uniref:Uncharacterized protein n=1 Tax=Tritrichomonas foetus TaxID=1144522 RepID=A0A1J4K0P1_9EUKA|nr:hypothetical protein TRFO_28160 [Tritrichomonas foetus]|eukprot:OHT04336.1 hypothetical protein TRFO_28160 [Tritrichomonas foetus]